MTVDRLQRWFRALRGVASTRLVVEQQATELADLRRALADALRSEEQARGRLQAQVDQTAGGLGALRADIGAAIELLRAELAATGGRVDQALALRGALDALEQEVQRMGAAQQALAREQEAASASFRDHVAGQREQWSQAEERGRLQVERIAQLAAKVAQIDPPMPGLAAAGPTPSATWLDAAFEETFRGTRVQIKERLAVHVEDVRAAHVATGALAAIDVGCGRGEWLELMRAANIPARGIDQNALIVRQCTELGLEAVEADAVEALAAIAERSLCAVTAFHLVEHLPLNRQLQLMVAAHRALAPGGVLLLETPNPENLVVGAWTFYMDPTHARPIPPTLLRFLVEAVGFEVVDEHRLHADDGLAARAEREGWPTGIRELLCAPRDFAIVARRRAGGLDSLPAAP